MSDPSPWVMSPRRSTLRLLQLIAMSLLLAGDNDISRDEIEAICHQATVCTVRKRRVTTDRSTVSSRGYVRAVTVVVRVKIPTPCRTSIPLHGLGRLERRLRNPFRRAKRPADGACKRAIWSCDGAGQRENWSGNVARRRVE